MRSAQLENQIGRLNEKLSMKMLGTWTYDGTTQNTGTDLEGAIHHQAARDGTGRGTTRKSCPAFGRKEQLQPQTEANPYPSPVTTKKDGGKEQD